MRVVVCSLAEAPGSKLIAAWAVRGLLGGGWLTQNAIKQPRTGWRDRFAEVFGNGVGSASGFRLRSRTQKLSTLPAVASCSMHSAEQCGQGIRFIPAESRSSPAVFTDSLALILFIMQIHVRSFLGWTTELSSYLFKTPVRRAGLRLVAYYYESAR